MNFFNFTPTDSPSLSELDLAKRLHNYYATVHKLIYQLSDYYQIWQFKLSTITTTLFGKGNSLA